MTLHQLVLFVSVAETRNLSATSARLRVSQPAVTRQLRALGEEFGIQLYFAKGRGVELTPEGERFLQHARNVVTRMAQLEDEFRPPLQSRTQPLCIGASFQASAELIPAVMRDFVESFPGVKLHFMTDTAIMLLRSILSGELDLAVVSSLPAERESVTYEIVGYYTPVLVGPAGHSLTRKRSVTARDLKKVPFIFHRDGLVSRNAKALLWSAGVEPRIAMECQNAEGIKAAVIAGMGFGLLFEEYIAPELRTGLLGSVDVPFLKAVSAPRYAVYLKNKPPWRALQGFIDLLYARARSLDPPVRAVQRPGRAVDTRRSGGRDAPRVKL